MHGPCPGSTKWDTLGVRPRNLCSVSSPGDPSAHKTRRSTTEKMEKEHSFAHSLTIIPPGGHLWKEKSLPTMLPGSEAPEWPAARRSQVERALAPEVLGGVHGRSSDRYICPEVWITFVEPARRSVSTSLRLYYNSTSTPSSWWPVFGTFLVGLLTKPITIQVSPTLILVLQYPLI